MHVCGVFPPWARGGEMLYVICCNLVAILTMLGCGSDVSFQLGFDLSECRPSDLNINSSFTAGE